MDVDRANNNDDDDNDDDEDDDDTIERTQVEDGDGDQRAEDFSPLVSERADKRRLKKLKTVDQLEEERDRLRMRFEEEFNGRTAESGPDGTGQDRPPAHHFPSMLRSTGVQHIPGKDTLPQVFLNEVWMRVLERGVGSEEVPEMSLFEVQAMASGLAPDQPMPMDPNLAAILREINTLITPRGEYIIPAAGTMDTLPGEEGMDYEERVRRRYQERLAAKKAYVEASADQTRLLRRRQGMAGIPELARVLATCNALWRRWWHRDFPRQAREWGTSAWGGTHIDVPAYLHESAGAPRPPRWILGMTARHGLGEAEAGVEAQYSECAWRRYYAWTQFWERRCYRLILDIEEIRASEYRIVRPSYTPHGVYWSEPLVPDHWRLQAAEDKLLHEADEPYIAWCLYRNGADNNEDVDRELDLDAVAQLIPQDSGVGAPLSAGAQAYIALRHFGDGVDQVTLDGPCRSIAHISMSAQRRRFVYNFLDRGTTAPLDANEVRRDRYCDLLLSYILWAATMAQRNAESAFVEAIRITSQRAGAFRLPVRLNLLDPLEQAAVLNLYVPRANVYGETGVEGSWPLLEALPVLPMRGTHGSENRIHGQGGVRFVGDAAAAAFVASEGSAKILLV
jgi:hypothetical protein